ncbi:SUKH-4 family immunity protein [Streptomyces sp. NBC_00510]
MPPTVTRALLESVFPPGELVTLDDPAMSLITHEPSREFLRDIGLPLQESGVFVLDPDFPTHMTTIHDWHLGDDAPPGAAGFLYLAQLHYDHVVLDGASGRVWALPEAEPEVFPLHEDLHSLAYFLCAAERERPAYDPQFPDAVVRAARWDPRGAADRLLAELRPLEPMAFGHENSPWSLFLQDASKGFDGVAG